MKQMIQPGPRYEATLQLLRTAEMLWNGSRLFFARWDLSPSQFNILNLLRDASQGMSQIELSRYLIMHRSNVTGLVDRLEARGLVLRAETPGDRRAYRVGLTQAGTELMDEVLPHYYRAAEEIWGGAPVGRTQELLKQLTEVCANIERQARELREGQL
ncbi:MAG TPA: MarR family transcriptional regulator [Candidatus Paceibacterota bacterium]|nr:MarR family transcriptional regulator [Verrucomicrobiota bacterium]HRY48287.1 MarR family transcriptional regulator [Candidatus Paceibacterota bacterium]HRZ99604.1 MarR family transcriptional regulator [Candidatus Paceibacterota bacterium]